MRKIIVLEFMSLDGVIQGPGGRKEDPEGGFDLSGWTAPLDSDESGKLMQEQMNKPFDLLLGRKTFDIWVNFWPSHAEMWPGVNEAHKYVVSSTLKESTWQNSVFINDNVVEEIKELKAEDGPDIQVYGSANLVQTLFKNDLVDELWLKTYPLTLGKGKKLFAEGTQPFNFKLVKSNVTPTGIIFANYVRDGEVKTGDIV
ncbi:MAG: dihydrofolate reductase family protein [Candidatus Dojkabacteria bacterium]